MIKCYYFINFNVILIVFNLFIPILATSNTKDKNEWLIIFYTGTQIWGGTDRDIFIKLHGKYGDSDEIRIRSARNQLEYGTIDKFKIINNKNIGQLDKLTVRVELTNVLFSDWNLNKVEIIDPLNQQYLFKCNCFLTNNHPEQILNVFHASTHPPEIYKKKETQIVPFAIGLIIWATFIAFMSYLIKSLYKKCRVNSNSNNSNRTQLISHAHNLIQTNEQVNMRGIEQTNNNLINGDGDDDGNGENNRAASSNQRARTYINPYQSIQTNNNNDKPPEYKELFPSNVGSNQR